MKTRLFHFSPILLGIFFLDPTSVNANNIQLDDTLSQVTDVSQLRDVNPSDWAYEALNSLASKYNCIAGYPDGSFRGNRPLTRYEFAAGLNACLQQLERMIGSNSSTVSEGDLQTLNRLTREFQEELDSLGKRVDTLDTRTQDLENHQFSTTTKLEGQVVTALEGTTAGKTINGQPFTDNQIVFGARTRLEFHSSFNGEDDLTIRFQANGLKETNLHTAEGTLYFSEKVADNNIGIDTLNYKFKAGEKTQVVIALNGSGADEFVPTLNYWDDDGASGAFSLFGTRAPIYYQAEDKGIGLNHQFNDQITLSLGYIANSANDPNSGNGLFNGPYAGIAQLTLQPTDNLSFGLTYLNAYNQSDSITGSNLSNIRTYTEDNFGTAVNTSSNSYGLSAQWKMSDKFILGGWVGYNKVKTLNIPDGLLNKGSQDIWNWAVTLALPDLGKEGNMGGILFGMEPKVTGSTLQFIDGKNVDSSTSYHVEAFYQYKVNDFITITPGLIWITAPDHNEQNSDAVMGIVRTTFSF